MRIAALVPFLSVSAFAAPAESDAHHDKRQAYGVTSKYCSTASGGLCYLQYYVSQTAPTYRVALPSDAAQNSAYDVVLQVIAPNSLTWAGFAWGGSMIQNPLTVVWPNGNSGQATTSSRWANSRSQPTVYSGATLKSLSSSRNGTHWSVEVVCTGCSKWNNKGLNVNGPTTFSWAFSTTAVQNPGNSAGNFPVHTSSGVFSQPLDYGKNAKTLFTNYINKKG
ncbi:hypothetical protein QBC42DRAFT_170844 [Cladorrhinum samala]|uniref:DOMON domain-containing protein n=1 Tax=Cladorrhinum samala TaxID=585594 RepID=A0AAV9HY00_9PEZI|nr:hypothetical protein QBC42DRAFT_170844 [Cladorrhinum samala]